MINALVLALAIAVAGVAPQKDPCTLLTPAEIQPLAPTAKIGTGTSQVVQKDLDARECNYTWGTGNNVQSGKSYFHITVTDAAKMYPGISPQLIKQGMQGIASRGGPNASEVAGVGESAIFESTSTIRAQATAYAKGSMLVIAYESVDGRAKKDQVIALLKAAVARL